MKQLTIGRRMSGLSLVELLIGMTLGLMPVTGLPLPFLSYGGSFLWICLFLAGMLIRFSWGKRDSLT